MIKAEILSKMVTHIMVNPVGSKATKVNVENAMFTLEIISRLHASYDPNASLSDRTELNGKLKQIREILGICDP